MNVKRFYVYTLTDPRDGSVFYVGKGQGNRLNAHFSEFKRKILVNARKHARIGQIVESGFKPVAQIVHGGLTENEAYRIERRMIGEYSVKKLTNILSGFVTLNDKQIDWAVAMIPEVKDFDQWCREKPRSDLEKSLFKRVLDEMRAMAAGLRPVELICEC